MLLPAYLHNFRHKLNVRYLLEILALQIAAKQLQLATWLLLKAYLFIIKIVHEVQQEKLKYTKKLK